MSFRRMVTIALALGLLAAPPPAGAQQAGRVYRIGLLDYSVADPARIAWWDAFRRGLQELGWVEGRTVAFETRWGEGKVQRLPDLAADLVHLKVDLIVVTSTPGARAATHATKEIPIVFGNVSDPVASGIVASLARPGGNATGWSNMLPELSGKLLELLKEVMPGISRVAVLWNPGNPGKALDLKEAQAAARVLGVTLQSLEVRASKDMETAFSVMGKGRPDGIITFLDALTLAHRQRIVDFAAQKRLPAVYQAKEFVQTGGLMSYAPNSEYQWHHAATLVDKILKGARPADLPVEQPTRFELAINLKTAKALGLTFPPSILVRADQVIQ
jgi:putative ABC transport system substrate-binding protein